MFEAIPETYRHQTADNEEEGWRYCQGAKDARRPPELLTRDHVSRCIVREIKEGRGSPHGGVFLDISWIKQKMPNAAEHIKRKLPSMYHQFKQLDDIDITEEPMQDLVGIVRTETEMREALEKIGNLKTRAEKAAVTGNREYNPGWHTAIDLKNLLTVSEAITRAALERKESRGAQFREDYPNKDDALGNVNTMVSKAADGSMQVRREPLPEMPDYLKQVIDEMK